MRQSWIMFFVFCMVVVLSSCQSEPVEPLPMDSYDGYHIYYEHEEYTILKRTEKLDTSYLMYALRIGPKEKTCIIGHYHEMNFVIQYEEKYYSVREADKLDIYDCSDLQESGFLSEPYEFSDPSDQCETTIPKTEETVAIVEGYEIKRTEVTCEMYVGRLVVDGYYFGIISAGCDHTLNSIGYYAIKDDETYKIQDLVDDGVFTTEEIYNIYICDEGHVGVFVSDEELDEG